MDDHPKKRETPEPSDEPLTRREWLSRGAGAVAAAGAAAVGGYLLHDPEGSAGLPRSTDTEIRLRNFFSEIDFPDSDPRISIAIGGTDRIERMVRAAVEGLAPSTGMKRFVSTGDVVLIKPNVGFDRPPHLGATTHPEVVRTLVRLCNEAGARRILIADNPIESPDACFARSGIRNVAEAEGAAIVLPTPGRFEVVTIRADKLDPFQGEALGRWPVFYEPLAEATKVIGVAPVKDHNLCSASMNLKNWYGLLGGRRNQLHQVIHNTISDLALMMSPTLVVADATRVMMRSGPTGGRISDVKPGGELGRPAVIASVDPVACDAWCYERLLGRDPTNLTYLDLAHAKIGAEIAGGAKRLAERDWRTYERQGKIARTDV